MKLLQRAAGVAEPALGVAAGLGSWFYGVAVLPVPGSFPVVEAPLGNHSVHFNASM